jgi:hypothetical protein
LFRRGLEDFVDDADPDRELLEQLGELGDFRGVQIPLHRTSMASVTPGLPATVNRPASWKAYRPGMEIEILHVPGCPNLGLARARLAAALEQTATAARVHEVVVADPAEAHRRGMHGSPTITIDGRDPFGPPATGASLSCRLYWSGGRADGAPGFGELIEAIGAAQSPA